MYSNSAQVHFYFPAPHGDFWIPKPQKPQQKTIFNAAAIITSVWLLSPFCYLHHFFSGTHSNNLVVTCGCQYYCKKMAKQRIPPRPQRLVICSLNAMCLSCLWQPETLEHFIACTHTNWQQYGMNSISRFTTSAINKIYLHKPKISSPCPSITVKATSQPCQTLDHDTQLSKSSSTNKHNSGGNNFYLAIYHTPGIATSKPSPHKQTAITSLPRSSN